MNTARAQKNATVGSKGNSSQSNLFIAPKKSKKKSEKSNEDKNSDLFIVPTVQESEKETTVIDAEVATKNVSESIPKSKGIGVEQEEKKEDQQESLIVETQQKETQTPPIVAKEISTNTTTTTDATVAGSEAKTTQKSSGKVSNNAKGSGGGGGKAFNVPDAVQSGGAEKEKVKEDDAPVTLPTENSKVYADGLASQTPTNFIKGVKQSSTTLTEVQGNEQKTLTESLPEIEQPTGVPTKSAVAKQKSKAASDKVGNQLKSDKSILPDLSPTGKKEGAQIPTKSVQPPSSALARIRSFFGLGKSGSEDDRKSQIKSGIKKLPTSESVATSPGKKPEVDLTGQADPNKNQKNLDESTATTNKEQSKNLAESKLYKGENDIYPEMELEMMSPNIELTSAPSIDPLAEEMPAVSAEVKNSFDINAQAHMDKELAPEMAKQDAEYAKMQADQEKAHKKSETDIDNETKRVKKEQETAQNTAKSDVDSQRGEWQKENENVKKEYSEKSEAEKKKIDGKIDTEVKDADTKITKEYDTAQKEADKEVAKTDSEAAREKAQAKKDSENKSWWDRAIDAVSDFFDKLKEGLNKLFDKLRKLVKGLIEAAKKYANKLIDLARDAIVGMIKVFGEVLKGFVNIALAAFPKLRDKFNAAIDKTVNVAVDAVNAFAEELKKAVSALLDLLGSALDAILSLYQFAFNLLLDAMKLITVGLLKILKFIANIEEHYNNFIAMIEGLQYLWNNPQIIEDYVMKLIQPYIDQIPDEAQKQLTDFFGQVGESFLKHSEGIWRYLKPILSHLASNWWGEIKKMAWFMIWPFAEGSPVWTETPKLWNLIPQMWNDLKAGDFNKVTDGGLEWFQALNIVAGTFYGWFAIGSILVGAIIGAFFGGAGAIPGAMAGLELAYAVGEGMLFSMIGAESALILKAIYDLFTTEDDGKDGEAVKKKKEEQKEQSEANNGGAPAGEAQEEMPIRYESGDIETGRDRIEYAYQRIANSGFALAIMGVFMAFGALGGNIAKALKIKARFRLARMKIKKTKGYQKFQKSKVGQGLGKAKAKVNELGHKSIDVRKGFGEKKNKVDGDEVKPIMTEHGESFGQATTKEGHTVTVTKNGDIYICASPCDIIQRKYPELKKTSEQLDNLQYSSEAIKEIQRVKRILDDIEGSKVLSDQQKANRIATEVEPQLSSVRAKYEIETGKHLIHNKHPKDPLPTDGKFIESSIGDNGLILDKNGIGLHAPQRVNFIIDIDGNLVLGKRHVTLSGGGDAVQAAGSIRIKRGRVTEIDNGSGHFEPTKIEAAKFKQLFEDAGVDVSKARENYKYSF